MYLMYVCTTISEPELQQCHLVAEVGSCTFRCATYGLVGHFRRFSPARPVTAIRCKLGVSLSRYSEGIGVSIGNDA